ncbi:protein lin-9 homolog isoform X2 [Lycorma delicatula]
MDIKNEVKMEVDDDDDVLGPAALGLKRVGEDAQRNNVQQPLLNRRGMPQRIRKKNKLFYDDDVINTLLPRSRVKNLITKTPPKPKPPPRSPRTPKASSQEVKREGPDRRLGQKIGMRLRNLLKLPKAHKWVCYEWFYSNIDKALFEGDNDFKICMKENFPQLKTRILSKVEWCKMRRMMGKPRRCSQAFFDEERKELERKRAKIRMLQQRKGSDLSGCKDLPNEIPLQLVIGSKVTARLRKPQDGLFTGSIDAVDTSNNTYRITFERPGLGTHSVPDYEVLSNEPPDTIAVTSFSMAYRPRPGSHSTPAPRIPPPIYPRLTADPMLSSGQTRPIKLCPIAPDGTIGGYPVKILEKIVRLNKILNIKQLKIDCLRSMNAEVERKKSFGELITEDFQKSYAHVVIELDFINKNLKNMLTDVQQYCQEINPRINVAAILTPVHLKEQSMIDARDMVARNSTTTKDPKVIELITDLMSLMLQVKSLSESDRNAYEVEVLSTSMKEIRDKLSPANQRVFENCVEVHMRHIQAGLGGHVGPVSSFMAQRAAV